MQHVGWHSLSKQHRKSQSHWTTSQAEIHSSVIMGLPLADLSLPIAVTHKERPQLYLLQRYIIVMN